MAAKSAFENLTVEERAQLSLAKLNKLDALMSRLALLQTNIEASRSGGTVTAIGLGTAVNTASDLNAGSDVNITLTVEAGDNISQSDEIAADSNIIVASVGSDQTLSTAFDVRLFKTVTEATGNITTEAISEADAPVYLTLELPAGMRGGTDYKIYHVHTLADGSKEIETIEATYNADSNPPTISFWISKFSTIKIGYTSTPAPATYTLNYVAGANGTITGTALQTVKSGANGTAVTAVPNAGYYFVSWSDGGTTATRTDSNVIGNLSVTATFAAAGSGGGHGGSSARNTAAKPTITLVGNAEITITINSPYHDEGATAKDGKGVDITSRLVSVNTVHPEKVGDYTVTYNVTDAVGNVADQVIRTVHVTGVGIVDRLSGQDRVDTALEIAKAIYAGKVTNVILATAENYPDALAGSVLAYKLNAPILLVGSSDGDQEKVLAYMQANLDPAGTVYILGGDAVVSKDMETKIESSGFQKINRLYGTDRFETAERIAEHMNVEEGTPIVMASGETYADALSISSMAAINQYPILLVKKDEVADSVKKEISVINPSKVYIIGLQGAISNAVEDMVLQTIPIDKSNIIRIGGWDRFETSLEIAKQFNSSSKSVCVATGNNFPDALAGSVFAAEAKAPIILVDKTLSETVVTYLRNHGMTRATIFGGEAVVSKEVLQELSQIVGQ